MDQEIDWQAVRRFHGHLGPWLALGIRIGQAGLRALNARPHFGIRVTVRCPQAPPPSCIVDGLQWGTGATYGKQNLKAEPGEPIRVHMQNTDTGASVLVTLMEGVPDMMRALLDELGDEAATFRIWAAPQDELFQMVEEAPAIVQQTRPAPAS